MSRGSGFRDVLGVAEFRALWSAELISVFGDQLARVALSVLVYERTSSATLTALTYALTFVPALLGGAMLAGLADRFPRRAVLITTDLLRAVLAGALALPGLGLSALWTLVFALALVGAPFKAAQLALLPTVLHGDRYSVGLALRTVSTQLAQLVGFAGGGAVLLFVSPHTALGVNATSFLISATIVAHGVQSRPAARSATNHTSGHAVGRKGTAVRVLAGSPRLLVLVGLIVLTGLTVAPEGVAAPYAAGLGASAVAVGVLLAADPLGSVLGAWVISRWRSSVRTVAVVPWAVGSGVALIPCFVRPGLVVSAVLWGLSGAMATMLLIQAQAVLTRAVPDSHRGAVVGLASAGLQTSQGLAVLATGVAGQHLGVYRAVGLAGAATVTIAALLGAGWRRARRRNPGEDSEDEHGMGHGRCAKVTGHGCASGRPPLPDRAASTKVRWP